MRRSALALLIIPVLLISGCRHTNTRTIQTMNELLSVIEEMRSDPRVMAFADSMGVLQLGAGTKCLDPIKHTYARDGRLFLYNDDWGGVLELPQGWIPEDDLWQVGFSFHGTHVWSPDSTILFSTYSGYSDSHTDQLEYVSESLAEDGFQLKAHEESLIFIGDEPARCFSILARGEDGIIYLGKYVTVMNSSIEYSMSLQYYENEEGDRIDVLKTYLERYPLGPEGQAPIGDCLL